MSMKAVYYESPRNFEVKEIPIPEPGDEEVLFKVSYCGLCGTDCHIHDGEFIAQFPLVPGHEVVGTISKLGSNVPRDQFKLGDRCVADNCFSCEKCFYCRRGRPLLCEDFRSKGVTMDGGFAEYVTFNYNKVYPIHALSDTEATLIEPAACAIHGADRLKESGSLSVGTEVLVIGAGPTGLILAQLLRLNGASHITIIANKGIKTLTAQSLHAGDTYIELERGDPERVKEQWGEVRERWRYGFDVVVEATGSERIINDAIDYVRRGGTLMVYGVYDNEAMVHWKPSKIFGDEIKIIGSFAQTHCFPRAVAYLESGKINVKGMVTDVFKLQDYQKALDKIASRDAVKVIIDARAQ